MVAEIELASTIIGTKFYQLYQHCFSGSVKPGDERCSLYQ
jgi:hypothetical protein